MEKIIHDGVRIISSGFSESTKEIAPFEEMFARDPIKSGEYLLNNYKNFARCFGLTPIVRDQ